MIRNKTIKVGGKSIVLEAHNARTLRVCPIDKNFEKLNSEGDIVGLSMYGQFSVELEGLVELGEDYRVMNITKITTATPDGGPGYYLKTHVLSKSSTFIMPLLGRDRHYFKWKSFFCNCFIGTESNVKEDYGKNIFLLYRHSPSTKYSELRSSLQFHSWYKEAHKVDDYHILYEFTVPKGAREDFDLLVRGKYSKITSETRYQILKFHGLGAGSWLHNVLTRSDGRKARLEKDLDIKIARDSELYDPFIVKQEIYLNGYKINKNGTKK